MAKIINKYRDMPVQLKASLWFLVSGFLQKGISMISTPIFTRLMSISEYGQYNTFNSWMNILTVFITLRLYGGMYTRGLVKYKNNSRQYASSMQGLCLVLVLFWLIIYLVFPEFWNELFDVTTVQMLAMIIMIWATAVFTFWSISERVELRYKLLVVVTIIVSIAKPLVGVIFVVLANDKVTARILGLMLVEILGYTFFFFYQMKKGKTFYNKSYWKEAILLNIPLIPHYLSMTVLNSADKIMISNMIGSREAGIYSLAYSVSQIMTIFNSALLQTLEPWLYKKIESRQIEQISKVAYPAFVAIMVVNLALMLFAPEVVAIFAPESYYEAIWIIPPVALGVFFMFMYNFFAVFEFSFKRTKQIAIATSFGALLKIILNWGLLNIFGYLAAGYTTLLCYIVYAICHYIFMQKICKVELEGKKPYNTKVIIVMSVVFISIGLLTLLTYKMPVIRYSAIVLVIIISLLKRNDIKTFFINFIQIKKNR